MRVGLVARAAEIEVRDTLPMAVGLVVLIVFLFLASLRSAIITMVTIPLSLLSAIVFMTRRDFSVLGGILRWGFVVALVLIVAGVLLGFLQCSTVMLRVLLVLLSIPMAVGIHTVTAGPHAGACG